MTGDNIYDLAFDLHYNVFCCDEGFTECYDNWGECYLVARRVTRKFEVGYKE